MGQVVSPIKKAKIMTISRIEPATKKALRAPSFTMLPWKAERGPASTYRYWWANGDSSVNFTL